MLGIQEKVIGIVFFDDLSLVHEDDAVTHCSCEPHFMGNAYHRDSFACKLNHHVKHF